MLSEKQLDLVQGGWFIDLVGIFGFIGAQVGSVVTTISGASYQARDGMGQTATVQQAGVSVSPSIFGSFGFGTREQTIKVLNSDDVHDLAGAKIAVGAVATLPARVQESLGREYGAKHDELFGIAIPHNAVGAEVSIPIVSTQGKPSTPVLVQVSAEKTNAYVSGGGISVGVNLTATLSLTDVKVTDIDQTAMLAYMQQKQT